MYIFRLFDQADPLNPVDARLLQDGVLRIGRDPTADWVIVDPACEVSRQHLEVGVGADGLTMRCTGANGVYDDLTNARFPDGCEQPLAIQQAIRFGRFRMVAEHAAGGPLRAGDENRTMVLTPPLGDSVDVPSDWADGAGFVPVGEEGSLLEAFCEGAGLDASVFSTEEPTEVMRRAGAIYRQMVLGVGDIMSERERARARHRLALTTIGGEGNNPFKWAPTQRLAIDLLLAGEQSFLPGPEALKDSFRDIKVHLAATFAGMQASLRTAIRSFEPARIDAAVNGRGSILKGRAALQWEEACSRHADLVRQIDAAEEGSLNTAFVDGYNAAANDLGRDGL